MANLDWPTIQGDIGSWEPATQHVAKVALDANTQQPSISDNKGIDFIEAGTVLICAGPVSLDRAGETGNEINVVPIGLIEQMSVQQSRSLQRIFEIGSKLSYIVPGRTVGGFSLNRMFFDGPSLLRMATAGEMKITEEPGTGDGTAELSDGTKLSVTSDDIGYGGIQLNFASKLLELPMGLMMYFRNAQDENVSAVYFEEVRLSSHSFAIASQSTVIAESVNAEFVRVRPIQIVNV